MMGHKKRFYGNLANYPCIISFTPSYLEGALIFKVNGDCWFCEVT